MRLEAGSQPFPGLKLVQLRGRDFNTIVRAHHQRLLTRWSALRIDLLDQEFQALLTAYESEDAFKNTLKGCNEETGFEQGWACTGGRFPVLREFCGGLATVFPGTATVESDFSIVKYTKNDFQNRFLTRRNSPCQAMPAVIKR